MRPSRNRGGRFVIGLAVAGALAIYAWGMAPTVLDRDSAELQTVALTGGVAHPTGYPLFTLVGGLFGRFVPGDPAFRINLMSVVFGALSLGALVQVGLELGLGPPVALAAAMLFGAGFSFWAGALRAEVYSLSTFVFLLAYWRVLVALRTDLPRDRRVAAFLLGLSLTGQLSCVPAVAVMGGTLLWRSGREGRAAREWPALAGALVLGLLPYLSIPIADVHGIGLDHLKHVDRVYFPRTGEPHGFLDTPLARLKWLVAGRNIAPGTSEGFHPGEYVRTAQTGGALMVLFELGPIVTLLLIPGFRRLLARRRGEALRLLVMVVASAAFAARVVSHSLIPIFLIYSLAQLALVGALGLEWLAERLATRAGPRRVAWLVPLLAVLVMIPPHALRLRAYTHPIPPGQWSVRDEDIHWPLHLIWRWQDPYRFRDFGAATMRLLPESTLVVGRWRELPVLYYFRDVLGERADLSFQPWVYPGQLARFADWQAGHDLSRHPIAFLTMSDDMRPHLTVAESIDVSRGYRVTLATAPLRDLPPPGTGW